VAEDLEALAAELVARGHDEGLVRRRLGLPEPAKPSEPEDVARALLLERARGGDARAAEALLRLAHGRELKDLKAAVAGSKPGGAFDRERRLREVVLRVNTVEEEELYLAPFEKAEREGADALTGDEAKTFVRLHMRVEVAAREVLGSG
jgi:hypothetical protein